MISGSTTRTDSADFPPRSRPGRHRWRRLLILVLAVGLLLGPGACSSDSPDENEETSEETARADSEESEWCVGHGLPESHCTKCHPELEEKFKAEGDWCDEHGFPESACPECNPMDPPGESGDQGGESQEENPEDEWCAGHGLPESHCTKCHPELEEKFKAEGDWCDEHGFPESACPECNPMDPPGGVEPIPSVESGTKIVLRKSDHEEAVGIETVPTRQSSMDVQVEAPTRLEFNRNQYADVRAAVPGIVREVRVDVGDTVDRGDPLFVLESADIGEAQAEIQAVTEELNTARANLERQERLFEKGLAAERKVEEARRDFEEVESRLSSLRGRLQIAGGSDDRSTGRYTVHAPVAGKVADRPAVVGEYASEETSLATVVDTSTMWAMLDVPERHGFALETGQPVQLTVGRTAGRQVHGEITWISPEVDPRTHTIEVLAEVDNSDGNLRANQFARTEIEVSPSQQGVTVPDDAIQRLDEGTVVFVRTRKATYEPRVVEIQRRDGDDVQVRGDLEAGESVVTTGAFILKTELSRDAIGAGCCEVEEQ